MKSLRLKRQFDSHILKMSRQTSNFYAVLGDHAGNVEANDRGDVYIRDWGGNVSIVYNRVVPLDYNTVVEVGKVGSSRRLEVIRLVETIPGNRGIDIPQHAKFHTWGGKDTVWIREEQILQGLAIPVPSSLVVRYYGTRYSIDGTRHILVPQDIDLSSEVPSSSGAYWCNVEVDSDGDIFFNLGTPVISKYFLAPEDIPEVDTDRALLFTVKLYYGQTQIVKDLSDSDIWDPRFEVSNRDSGTGGGVQSVTGLDTDNTDPQNPVVAIAVDGTTITGDGTPGNPLVATGGSTPAGDDGEIQFNDGGAFGASATFKRNSDGSITIGTPIAEPTPNPYDILQGATGTSAAHFIESFGADVASYITFFRARGTHTSAEAVLTNDVLGRIRARGHDGAGVPATRAEIRFVANADWDTDDHATRVEIWTTPDGEVDQELIATIDEEGISLEPGKDFMIDGLSIMDGWRKLAVQPTRTAADDPTYSIRFTGVDYREYLAEGTPVKFTQNSIVRYGFVNAAPLFSSGNTNITILTRLDSSSADYDVLDTGTHAITNFAVALPKQPGLGFPALPVYWTTSLVDSSNQNVSTPGTGIVNPGSLSLVVPIGAWNLSAEFIVWVEYTGTNTRHSVVGGIGDSNSSFYSDMQFYFLATSTNIIANGGYTIKKYAVFTSKTTLYVNAQCATPSPATSLISIRGGQRDTELRAVSAYL